MPKINLKGLELEYKIKRHKKAKRISLTISGDSLATVTLPVFAAERRVEEFIRQQADWVIKKINYFQNLPKNSLAAFDPKHYATHRADAENEIKRRVAELANALNLRYARVSIRNQRSRWGSCSIKGNLNFNYKLLFLPRELADYIIVHELCHLKEMNHSPRFWHEVAKILPDFQNRRRQLRRLSCARFP